jgi:hypothetical protein
MKVFWSIALLCAGTGLLSGCAEPEAGTSVQTMLTRQSAVAVAGQEKGRGYFLRECGACHRHYWPGERSVDEWRVILLRKKNKVSLTAAQFQQLSDYVIQASTLVHAQP